jgi:putative hydrolase of the HAD superfamily
MTGAGYLSFWVLPTGSTAGWFRERIRELADSFGAPRFEPHITVYGGRSSREAGIASARAAAAATAPMDLRVAGVGTGESLTRTGYGRVQPHAELAALRDRIASALGEDSGYRLDPHLSLIYHDDLPAAARERLAADLEVPWRQVRMATLVVIDLHGPVRRRRDVRRWEEIARIPLSDEAG